MRPVAILGLGQTPVGEHWGMSLRVLGEKAVTAALLDAGIERPEMLFVGNMLSGQLNRQENLGALIADHAGLRGVEAVKIEAACASGAMAVRMAYLAVAGGLAEVAVACGVEKMSEAESSHVTAALASATEDEFESAQGVSFVALNALLMRRYMHIYGYRREDFAEFALTAHRNAMNNPNAMFQRAITREAFLSAKMIAEPVSLMDSSGMGDGAAAVVLAPLDLARRRGGPVVCVAGSASATDAVALMDRDDPLWLEAAHLSTQRALAQAGATLDDVDLFELHDAFTIMSALSLEAAGFALRGGGARLAMEGQIGLGGRIPIATLGGLKARGHPVGATGVYQIVEAAQQLRGQAGKNQIAGCRLAMTQNIGGSGANIVTHLLERFD